MRAGNFLPALEVRAIAPAGTPGRRRATGEERVCPLPPLPHFRLPPLPRPRLPGPVRPEGDPAAQPHPSQRGPLPRPRRRLAGADRLSQPGRRARQELTWTQILGQPWSASSSAFGSGRNSLRTFYSLRQSLSSPYPTCISSRTDPL
ncbi:protein SYS1 homolog isoform X2 [Camelus dromedarius]|uniref:protein SYS1 homolog isoform X2 n=1 Tax=Camelus dromedarius TaxID=9838 RepID=UPI0031196488